MHARSQWRARRGSLVLLTLLIALGAAVAVLLAIPAAALIAVLAALIPARRAARLHPSELLRAE